MCSNKKKSTFAANASTAKSLLNIKKVTLNCESSYIVKTSGLGISKDYLVPIKMLGVLRLK